MKSLRNIDIHLFQQDLLKWYQKNKRDLPWRVDKDPYKIWVSEIMLQQTRVDTVIPYFDHFMKKYPTIYDLAQADSEEILKAWEGLGYYSRARNLHESVREVVQEYDGKVPTERKQLESLKGIGPYTSGAILSIAYDQPEPAVDGNVMRVLSRLLQVEDNISEYRVRKNFSTYTEKLISDEDPSSFNQGLMELGALICTPKAPKCSLCPVQKHCQAYTSGVQHQLPIREKAKIPQEIPYVVLIVKNKQGQVGIEKRPPKGLLANLWQFPMVPVYEIGMDHLEHWFYNEYGMKINLQKELGKINHIFSHLIWDLTVYKAELQDNDLDSHLTFVHETDLDKLPFSVAHLKVMEHM